MLFALLIIVAATDMRYFAGSKFSKRLVNKKKFWLDMTSNLQVRIFILLSESGRIPLLSLNEFGEKSLATIILGTFVNKPKSNTNWITVFVKSFSLVKI